MVTPNSGNVPANSTRMTDKIVVFSTCGSKEEAERLARRLLQEHVAACVNVISPVQSFYWWKGAIEAAEWLLAIKTSRELFGRVRATLESAHSYELPEVLALPIVEGFALIMSGLDGRRVTCCGYWVTWHGIGALIFDMDGVLIDSNAVAPARVGGIHAAARSRFETDRGHAAAHVRQAQRRDHPRLSGGASRPNRRCLSRTARRRKRRYYREMMTPQTRGALVPGVVEFISGIVVWHWLWPQTPARPIWISSWMKPACGLSSASS